jgi:hypothetical protein
MFKKDAMITGILIGILVPVLSFGLLYGLTVAISKIFTKGYMIFTMPTLAVLSIFINVLFFRYFMMKRQQDYIGRGILLATFLYAFVYFFKFW